MQCLFRDVQLLVLVFELSAWLCRYGEDPYLAGEMVYQNVLGIQGFGLDGYPHHSLANTGCKHFSAFDGPLNNGDAVISDEDWFLELHA